MASSHPTFVIVPGAWHPPAAFEKLLTHLKNAGYQASIPSLPSCDTSEPKIASCSSDAEAVRKQILALIETEGKDVVVVCFSYGGIPGGGAASGLSKGARIKEGKKGGIIGLAYISGFVVPENLSVLEMMGGKHAPYVNENQPSEEQCTIEGPKHVLYNDLNDDEAAHLIGLLRPTSMHALDSKAPPAAWAQPEFAGRIAFLRCMQDQALPPFLQDMFMEKSGVAWKVKDIEASHSPFASKPAEMVEILGEWAQEFAK